ncbi:MAG: hypothetical protein WBA25_08575 [Jannaschia sp.]
MATLGAAGVEVSQNVLSETRSAVLPPVPYFHALHLVFVAVALMDIAIAVHTRLDDWKLGQ